MTVKSARKPAKSVGVRSAKDNGAKPLPRGLPVKATFLPLGAGESAPSTYVGRLSTVADWHRQVGKIYREMRKHLIPPDLGTKLTYVANVGATLAKFQDELRELQALRAKLEALQGQPGGLGLTFDRGDAIDVSPAARGDQNAPSGDSGEGAS
jgi:hypothetical protein